MAEENTGKVDPGTNQGDPGSSDGRQTAGDASVTQKTEGKVQDTQLTKDVNLNGDKTQDVKSQAPEQYTDFTLPDGFTMDQGAIEAFSPVARELGMSQENAQKVIDLYSNLQQLQVKNSQLAINEERDKNIALVKADPELGGEKYDSNIKSAIKVINRFGSKELVDVLNNTGIGNSPHLIRLFVRVGKAMGEDAFVDKGDGGGAGAAPKTLAQHLYNTT